MHKYNQGVKVLARERLIKHAITALTEDRAESFLVSKEHFDAITAHFNRQWPKVLKPGFSSFVSDFSRLFKTKKNRWYEFYDNVCKGKIASELKILYLSGPEPLLDVAVFCDCGVLPQNIWAIESDRGTYEKALESLKESRVFVKIHRGSLAEFFELTNHEFDIVYFDACSPLLSPNQNPLETLKQIFINRRLTSLSCLITNFSEPRDNYNWGEILASWYVTKEYYQVPEQDNSYSSNSLDKSVMFADYAKYIAMHRDSYYEHFITHFIATFASEITPIWQTCALGSIQNNHLLNEQLLSKKLKEMMTFLADESDVRKYIKETQHYKLSVETYPLLNWARMIHENLQHEHVLNRFIQSTRKKMPMSDAMYIGSLLKRFEETKSGFRTFITDICSNALNKTLEGLDFFDRDFRVTCDIPMKNLFVELLFGLYGHPYIGNVSKNLSLKYKAKETWMYSNAFVFDQCRYLYDFLPTLDLWEGFFEDWVNQTIIRGCIDGIRRNHLNLNENLFLWGFIEGVPSEFDIPTLAPRENLSC
jgi:hypothetical protein